MSSEWDLVELGELTVNLDARRKPVKEADRKPGSYPYYGASGIVDYVDSFLFEGEHLLIAEDGENLRTRQTPVAFLANGKFWVNNHAHIVIGNDRASTRYLHYALLGTDISAYLTGAVMPKLTQGNLNRIEIPCPPQDIQAQIVSILGSLDDRIALLRETNATLESIAQAIFKSWFIDFDPVKARQQGLEPQGMDAATAALFPDAFQDSELGPIPAGWSVGRIENVLELAYGKALKSTDRISGDIPVYGSGGVVGYHNEPLVNESSVIVGRKGTVGSLYWEDMPFFPIDTVYYVKGKMPLTYCYYLLKTLGLDEMNTDAAVPGLNRNNVYRLPVIIPPQPLIDMFDSIVDTLRRKIRINKENARTLASIRDALLPRLISGRLRVPEAEAMAVEVGL
ncbi:MAG: restriction endonuclease subunit S [Chlorobiaceae bacterium]|nr:restriction endonuclease subunit S [Chlorobiaceae bacterium]